MAPRRQSQTDRLAKIGLEGFALIDDLFGRNKKHSAGKVSAPPQDHVFPSQTHMLQQRHQQQEVHHRHYHQQQHVYGGPRIMTVEEPVISSTGVAQNYGGTVVTYYTRKNPVSRAY